MTLMIGKLTDPDEDGQVLGVRRRVDVEKETVFVAKG
jgi:hypothetical protein